MEHHRCQQETNTLCSAVNCSRKTTGLATQMEVEVQSQKMVENVAGDFPNSCLGDSCEDSISKFLRHARSYPGDTICEVKSDEQPYRHRVGKIVHAMIIDPATV